MEKITREDLLKLKFVNNPVLSPDGKHTVYVEYSQNLGNNNYESRLRLLNNETGEVLPLTELGKEGPPIWLDSGTLLFPSERGEQDKAEEGEEKTCFYSLRINGGEARKAFEIPKNVEEIILLENGCFLLKVLENLRAAKSEPGALKEGKDYYVLEEIPFYSNGRGYISRLRRALYLFEKESGNCTKITSDFFDVASVDAEGSRIVYTGREYESKASDNHEARLYDLHTGRTVSLTSPDQVGVHLALLAGDRVILGMTDHVPWGMSQYDDLYVCDIPSMKTSLLAKVGLCMHGWMSCDCTRGGGKTALISGEKLFFVGQNAACAELYSVDLQSGELTRELPFKGCIHCFDRKEGCTVICGCENNDLSDLYLASGGKAARMTDTNRAFLQGKYVAEAKYVPFTDSDGVSIDGWVMEPKDFDHAKKYPGILHVHGGPRGTYGALFQHQMQMLCSEGYFVFFCNPRGGEGYGEEFADLRGKYGTIDYQDLMEFTDHVLALYPQLDPERLGETGGSYGGFMSNWIEGHTDRFAAIVSCCSISNWVADFVACEFGYTFDANEVGATPWDGMERMWEQSPLKYASQAKTPILFLHSLEDYNCPLDQGREMFIAMKYFGVPSKMVVFEGENHSLSVRGRPKQRQLRLKELQAWFDRYLKPEISEGV